MKRLLVAGVLALAMAGAQAAGVARSLPDFAPLVEAQAGVVVNISATRPQAAVRAPFLQPERGKAVPDWLKRLMPGEPASPDEEDDDGSAVGSGLVIGSDGYILTNSHVVEDASEILVRLADRREYLARLVGADRRADIALLKVEANNLPRARLGDPARLRVGDWVLAIGSPFGFESTVTAGIVSAKGRSLPDESIVPFIQTDVAINPGNSGGPLFNLKGEVIGINSQIYSRTGGFMGLSFAIPIDVAMDVQAQLRHYGRVRRGRIGVMVQEVTRDMAESFGLPEPAGALVSQVEAGGPAARLGLRAGDVIVRFNQRRVEGSGDLPRIVGASVPGSRASLEYWRGAQLRKAKIEVDEFPDDQPVRVARVAERNPPGANLLGIVVADASREQRRTLGMEGGVAIREVSGLASRAELRAGDVIVGVVVRGAASEPRSADAFNRLINGLPRGTSLTLQVRRGDTQSFVGMKLPGK